MVTKLCEIHGYQHEKQIKQIMHREYNSSNNRYKDLTVSRIQPLNFISSLSSSMISSAKSWTPTSEDLLSVSKGSISTALQTLAGHF